MFRVKLIFLDLRSYIGLMILCLVSECYFIYFLFKEVKHYLKKIRHSNITWNVPLLVSKYNEFFLFCFCNNVLFSRLNSEGAKKQGTVNPA